MTPEVAPDPANTARSILGWTAPIVLLLIGIGIWSNHFNNGFHSDDIHTIVQNHAIKKLSNIPRFFADPKTFSSDPMYADYRPLLSLSFALDAALVQPLSPSVFQFDSFVWFGVLIFSLFLIVRLLPGSNTEISLFAAALFGLHPVAADTVNYISQRGHIIGAAAFSVSLALWIIWPRLLPKTLGIDLNRVPQTWWQDQVRRRGPGWEVWYKRFRNMPMPLYGIPIVFALLAEPSVAVFPLILLVYNRLFDPKAPAKRLIPISVICGGYWLVQTVISWRVSPLFRISPFAWWLTQPWVALRYFFRFLAPFNLSADTDLRPLAHVWQPEAIAGFAGVAALVWCAVMAGRRQNWRVVSFGIWWFLIALIPWALVPQRTTEANSRMFLAAAGLAFALAGLLQICFERLQAPGKTSRVTALSATSVAAVALLSFFAFLTWERNQIWETEETLWFDVVHKSPGSALGLISYANAMFAMDDATHGLLYLQKAAAVSSDDPVLQIRLAQGFDHLNKDAEAESHFRKAISLAPSYSPAWSRYGEWLLVHQRLPEAMEHSLKGLALDPTDLISRHTLMDLYSRQSRWEDVAKVANEALSIDPGDPDAQRSLTISGASVDQMNQAEEASRHSSVADDFLKLSVMYYQNHRYEDCIRAAKSALKINPSLAEAYGNMATAYHSLGKYDDTIDALRQVIRLRPDLTFAKTDLEIVLREKEKAGSPK